VAITNNLCVLGLGRTESPITEWLAAEQAGRAPEWEKSRMNIFTIIGVVVVVILVAGYFGVHGVSF
jgi:hypothetical protein